MSTLRLVLLGAPGAGKGTQAKVIVENYGIKHVSTGDIFRELIKNGSDLGKKIKQYVESGALIPDEIVIEVVKHKIQEMGVSKGFILDGFPRTLKQARMLDETLGGLKIPIDKVLYFDTSEEMLIKRLSGRRTCKNCGAVYHLTNMPPLKEGVCDTCGGQLYQRKDDDASTVHNRLNVFREETFELIDYYKKSNVLETINGDLSKDDAFVIVKGILDKIG